jgi:hypothetical protein
MHANWLGKLNEHLNGDHKLTLLEHEDTEKQKESRLVIHLEKGQWSEIKEDEGKVPPLNPLRRTRTLLTDKRNLLCQKKKEK